MDSTYSAYNGGYKITVLLAGGAGYIGSHTAVQLLMSGHDVVIADDYSNSCPEVINRIEEITGKQVHAYETDVKDKFKVQQIFAENKIDCVIHFAGLKAVGESCRLPLLYYHNNLTGTFNRLECMLAHKVYRIVFSSSATVYGMPKTVPIREDFPLSTTNPYGETKLMIERILTDVAAANPELSVCLLRYFNPIGAHESGLIGEDPCGIPNNLLPYVAKVAAGKLACVNVFGNDYPTPDGTGVRDYIHVVDLALAHLKALDYTAKMHGTDAINIGTGNGYSVLEIIRAFGKAWGAPVNYRIAPRRPGDIAECYADPSKAERVLGWKAERDLDRMCVDAARWQRMNPDGYPDD